MHDESGARVGFEPCWTCPAVLLDQAMATPLGQIVRAAFELEYELESKITMSENDIPADEWIALKIVREERVYWQEAKAKRK